MQDKAIHAKKCIINTILYHPRLYFAVIYGICHFVDAMKM